MKQSDLPRKKTATQVPFFLRAWWLKDYELDSDISWHSPNWLTLPVFSLQSDPICDAGSVDFDI